MKLKIINQKLSKLRTSILSKDTDTKRSDYYDLLMHGLALVQDYNDTINHDKEVIRRTISAEKGKNTKHTINLKKGILQMESEIRAFRKLDSTIKK